MIDKVLDFPSIIATQLGTQPGISVMVLDVKGHLQFINNSFSALCHRKHFELLKSHFSSLPLFYYDPNGDQQLLAEHDIFTQMGVGSPSQASVISLGNTNNEILSVRIYRNCFTHEGQAFCVFIFIDISNYDQEQTSIKLFNQVFTESNEAIAITDTVPNILDVNPAFEAITGYSKAEVLGKNPSLLASGYHPLTFYEKFWSTLNKEGRWVGKVVNRRKNGGVYSEQMTVRAIRNAAGDIIQYVSIFSELHKPKKSTDGNIKNITTNAIDPTRIDELTGLPKQSLLIDRLDQAIGYARRHQFKVAIFCIDLDNFELINRTYGNKQGDKTIRTIAQNIQRHIREGDTLSRNSGDEYILVLRDLAFDFDIDEFSERLLKIINTPITLKNAERDEDKDKEISLTASVGISHYPYDRSTAEQLIRHASYAMSLAKSDGRARAIFFSPEYEKKKTMANAAKSALLDAVRNDEMRLHVQPQYNVATKQLYGIEFLIRWQTEEELIYPDQFLNSHKDPELLTAVDQWVITKAIDLLDTDLAFVVDLNLKIGINLTTSSLQNSTFHAWLIDKLTQLDRHKTRLFEIEILEHDALNNIQALSKLIENLKPLGVSFSLDDFGTGYSSLSIFNQLDVSTVKIDKKFVREMIIDSKNLSLVKAICEMSKIFGRKTIAEGVEYKEQADLLLTSGCHIIQGYSIAKPMPTNLFKAWVDNYRY